MKSKQNLDRYTESDVKEYLKKELLKKGRADGDLQETDLHISRVCKLRYFDGKPWKWEVGLSIDNGEETSTGVRMGDYYRAELVVTNKLVLSGIIKLRKEFTAEEASDLTYIASPELEAKRKWREYESSDEYLEEREKGTEK